MNKIMLNVASRILYVLNMFGTLIVAMILSVLGFEYRLVEMNELMLFGFFIVLYYLINRLTKKIPKGQVILELTKEGLQINWKRQFLFHNKTNILLEWNSIKDYMHQTEQRFNLFRIRTTDKRTFIFSMDKNNKEFPVFYESFEQVAKNVSANGSATIAKAKNVYESKYGLVYAIFIGILIVVGIVVVLNMESNSNEESSYGMLVGSMIGGIIFIFRVVKSRLNEKTVG